MNNIISIIALVFSVASLGSTIAYSIYDRRHRRTDEASSSEPSSYIPNSIYVKHSEGIVRGPFNIPTFGAPACEIYRAKDYEGPLHCARCPRILQEDEVFYSIPLSDQIEGTLLAVCLPCYGEEYRLS